MDTFNESYDGDEERPNASDAFDSNPSGVNIASAGSSSRTWGAGAYAPNASPSGPSTRVLTLPRIVTATTQSFTLSSALHLPTYPESSQRTRLASYSSSLACGPQSSDTPTAPPYNDHHASRGISSSTYIQPHDTEPEVPPSPLMSAVSSSSHIPSPSGTPFQYSQIYQSGISLAHRMRFGLDGFEEYAFEPVVIPQHFESYSSPQPHSMSGGNGPTVVFPAVAPVPRQALARSFVDSASQSDASQFETDDFHVNSQQSRMESDYYTHSSQFLARAVNMLHRPGRIWNAEPGTSREAASTPQNGVESGFGTPRGFTADPSVGTAVSAWNAESPSTQSSQQGWDGSHDESSASPAVLAHARTSTSSPSIADERNSDNVEDKPDADTESAIQVQLRRPGRQPSGKVQPKKGKIHACQICHKGFPRPSGLQTHMNSHSGARPFKCPFINCDKSFAVRSNARRHLRTHGVTPPNTRPAASSPTHYSVGFEPPIVMSVREPDPEPGRMPRKLRWIPSSLLGYSNLQELQGVEDYQRREDVESEEEGGELMEDVSGDDEAGRSVESEDEEGCAVGNPLFCQLPGVPLPPVQPSVPSGDVDAKYDERNSWVEVGTQPYHPSQWRCLPGPAVVQLST